VIQTEDRGTALEDGIGIWRYMDIAPFMTLIGGKALYLNRLLELHALGDPWEGVWPERFSRLVMESEHADFVQKLFWQYYSHALISCWHENERESVAMWKLWLCARIRGNGQLAET
jgi:hypothetical protein